MWQQEKEHLKGGVKNLNSSTFPVSPFDRLGVCQGIAGLFNTGHFALQEPCPGDTQNLEKDSSISR